LQVDQKQFWEARFNQLGHTGWKDSVIYAYDQLERLSIVSNQADQLDIYKLNALDFGCGTGDFSRILISKGFRVWGYDPHAEPKINHPSFFFSSDLSGIFLQDGEAGLILSVTVMDHIICNEEFENRLRYLREKISKNGFFILIEYALDNPIKKPASYQAFRSMERWNNSLYQVGWKIHFTKPIPHPKLAPSKGFIHFKNSFIVNILQKLFGKNTLRTVNLKLLSAHAKFVLKQYGVGTVDSSPLKLIICKPI
jgi:SAM-dependent methyltransferase